MGRVFKPRRRLPSGETWISPKWYIEFRDAGGSQHRRPASIYKREAEGLLRELEGAARRQALGIDPTPPPSSESNLEDLVDAYLEDAQARLKPRTHRDYTDSLGELLLGQRNGFSRSTKPEHLTDLNVRWAQAYQQRALAHSSPRTVNKKLRAVIQFLSWAVRAEVLQSNPLQHLQMLPQQSMEESRALSQEEIQSLLRVSSEEAQGIWTFFLETGMRKGEVASLTWSQVDFEHELITVDASKSKNHRSRLIPMTSRVRDLLQKKRAEAVCARRESVFPSIDSYTSFYEGCLKVFRRSCSKAGIEGVNIHSLRRTFTVRMLEAGASPAVVQRLLGHSTANLTLEVYAKVCAGDLSRAMQLLPAHQG